MPALLRHPFISVTLRELALEIYEVCFTLFKLMIPVLIVVKALEEMGAIPYISSLLEPLMQLVGLPESMGLVWTTTLLTNIYGGMLIFFQLAPQENLSVAQVTVLSALMLMAHGLPVEVRIVQQAGVRFLCALAIRMLGALGLGLILHHLYSWGDWLQQPAQLSWTPPPVDSSLSSWLLSQLESFAMIVVVVSALLSLLRFLRWIHVERLMIWLLQPVLKVLGIGPQATSLTIIGITLGLSFGGGLLIREARSGNVSQRDCFAALALLGLLHSLIEDTLLVLLLGADLSGVLWMRLAFSLITVALMTRWLDSTSESFRNRYLFHDVTHNDPPGGKLHAG
ncbi:hypothetical protein [Marinobacterium jannaschii]|uniref:hypothetical protein n=1 Tax=Marinobacterium jannaschii TaxID=64970 RepID=UPI000483A0CB|nr:hypothetical protein [Marinobacterium jannaschii]